MGSTSQTPYTFQWETDALDITLVKNKDGVICLRSLLPKSVKAESSPSPFFEHSDLPLTSIRLVGQGNTSDKTAKSLVGSYVSARLQYQKHEIRSAADAETLTISSIDEVTGLVVTNNLVVYKGVPVLRASATVMNPSENTSRTISQLSSLTIGGLTTSTTDWYKNYKLLTATNSWFREAQWREHSLPDIGIDEDGIYALQDGHSGSQATFSILNRGSFSTGSHLPLGLLARKDNQDTWVWQVEHNGSWRWEVGDFKDSIYLALGGPTSADHSFKKLLRPGESFTSVTTALGRVHGDVEAAFSTLTEYRRKIRRPHEDNEKLPVIFNDYMNCLMGDPDEDKIKALLDPVVQSGAEYFVIDAGWYADDGNWWDAVGLWEPSKKRFPSGFKELLNLIRAKGLIPGLWVEPEVVGVRSVVGRRLPEKAFFQDGGQRVVERGRFQLDYRHPEVIRWMDSVIERLVVEYGAGYFKFDYNIEVIQGTDANTTSPGLAHLEHQRAYLSWVKSLLDRYPGLVIENCSSGAQRMDYAQLSVHSLQSTSDQQDPILYAAIAAASPTAVTPEQSAIWTYPQPEWDDEVNAVTMLNSLLGRVYLSGRLDNLSPHQFELITEGIKVYKDIRLNLKHSIATWPLGLPRWHDDWISVGMVARSGDVYLAVWRRGGATEIDLPLPVFRGSQSVKSKLLYPSKFEAESRWDLEKGALRVKVPDKVLGRLFHLTR
ncbi:glycoside hydrolase family 36 protein [Hyaloscypha variabilis F]|uniref:alpha-galactosidase n=1 Tax=Hyaloscypha variabilis (strain UAMH 11265 / GT02V1 / F) TaxID=1149755 RepID=A0A2J6QVM5_HYAVF|nr:glycoside hydrolase family 36 protein [Hyaloscypha variabilis F]